AQILANGGGGFTIQAGQLNLGGGDLLKVSSDGSRAGGGNYALGGIFCSPGAGLTCFSRGASKRTPPPQGRHASVEERQRVLVLRWGRGLGAAGGSAVQMTITDGSGDVVYSLAAEAGDTVSSAALFLTPGAYLIRFTGLGPAGSPVSTLAYNLMGESISDPI